MAKMKISASFPHGMDALAYDSRKVARDWLRDHSFIHYGDLYSASSGLLLRTLTTLERL